MCLYCFSVSVDLYFAFFCCLFVCVCLLLLYSSSGSCRSLLSCFFLLLSCICIAFRFQSISTLRRFLLFSLGFSTFGCHRCVSNCLSNFWTSVGSYSNSKCCCAIEQQQVLVHCARARVVTLYPAARSAALHLVCCIVGMSPSISILIPPPPTTASVVAL